MVLSRQMAEEKAKRFEEENKFLKMSSPELQVSPGKLPRPKNITGFGNTKRIPVDPNLSLLGNSEKRKFFAALKYGLTEQDFLTVTQTSESGRIHFDIKTFGEFSALYQSQFSGVYLLKKYPNMCSIFPRGLAKDLVNESKNLSCQYFAREHLLPWGHDIMINSRRFYSISENSFNFYEASQLADYGHENGENLKGNLLALRSHYCSPWSQTLEHHAFNLCTSFGAKLDQSCFLVQLGFQHDVFPFHDEDAGRLGTNLQSGDGFGKDIFTYQIRGPRSWVYVAGLSNLPVKGKKFIGIKFEVGSGKAWGLTGDARFNCVHGILPTRVNSKMAHDGRCFSCCATFTVRNGCVSKADLAETKLA